MPMLSHIRWSNWSSIDQRTAQYQFELLFLLKSNVSSIEGNGGKKKQAYNRYLIAYVLLLVLFRCKQFHQTLTVWQLGGGCRCTHWPLHPPPLATPMSVCSSVMHPLSTHAVDFYRYLMSLTKNG